MSKEYGDGYCAGLEAGAEERDAVWRHADGLAIERDRLLSRVAEMEERLAGSVHSCHAKCANPACVMRRERDQLRTRVAELEAGIDHIIAMAGNPDAAEGCRLIIERTRELLNKSSAKAE